MESQNDRELAVLQELGTTLKNVSQKKQHDEEDVFAELLASQLRNLPVHEKLQVKMRINQLVYEALMKNSANSARAASCAPTCTTPASINYPWQTEASTGFTPEGSQGYTFWPASSSRYTIQLLHAQILPIQTVSPALHLLEAFRSQSLSASQDNIIGVTMKPITNKVECNCQRN